MELTDFYDKRTPVKSIEDTFESVLPGFVLDLQEVSQACEHVSKQDYHEENLGQVRQWTLQGYPWGEETRAMSFEGVELKARLYTEMNVHSNPFKFISQIDSLSTFNLFREVIVISLFKL